MTRQLIILGASGNAHMIVDVVDAINAQDRQWEVRGILDDNTPVGSTFANVPILGPLDCANDFTDHEFINSIGSDSSYFNRPALVKRAGVPNERFCTLIHPYAEVSRNVKIGRGSLVSFAAYVSGNAVVGNHVLIGPTSAVGHDAHIDDHVILARQSTVSGGVHVEQNVYLGANCVIKQGLRVGRQALVGLGAVVIRDVAPKTVVVGNPARPIR